MICCLARDRQFTDEDAELLGAVANQTAVGLKKAELIERLTAENIVKDMFDALAAGSVEAAQAKASQARCDLGSPHLFLHVERAPRADDSAAAWPELAARLEARLRRALSAGVLRLPPRPGAGAGAAAEREDGAVEELRAACESLGREEGLVVGLSDVDRGAASARRRMREAADAARIGRSLVAERRRRLLRAARRLPVSRPPASSTRRPATAIASRSRSWATTTAAAAPGWSRRWSSSSPTAAASAPAPGRSTCTRTRSASGSSGSSASPGSTWPSEDLLSLELALKLARLHHVRAETE